MIGTYLLRYKFCTSSTTPNDKYISKLINVSLRAEEVSILVFAVIKQFIHCIAILITFSYVVILFYIYLFLSLFFNPFPIFIPIFGFWMIYLTIYPTYLFYPLDISFFFISQYFVIKWQYCVISWMK